MARTGSPVSTPWLIASGLLLVATVMAFVSPHNRSWAGLTFGNDGVVSQVAEHSPGARANIEAGDRIVTIGGVAVGDRLARLAQLPPAIGETRAFHVARGDDDREVRLTYAALPVATLWLFLGAAAIGVLFLLGGVGAHLRNPSRLTRLMAWLGLAAMPALTPPLPVANEGGRMLSMWLLVSAGAAIGPLLVQIALSFPDLTPRASLVRWLLYGPVGLFSALTAVAMFGAPKLIGAVFIIGATIPAMSVIAALVITLVRWRRARTPSRRSALGILTLGMLIGIVPILVSAFATSLPGAGGYFLTLAALPLALAYGHHRGLETRPAPQGANPAQRLV